jgi:chromosome segregation protein
MRADGEWVPAFGELPAQLTFSEPMGLALPAVTEIPADLERRVGWLRRELRSIGGIDSEALAAYEESAEHLEHLRTERADLEAASADLREALATLEAEMAERFDRTFQDVAREFAHFFPALFGGGEAELVAVGDDGEAGVDIVARPPGKRSQPLALLSGGERSLTSVALIFALLTVSRTPFVVLDEVDAALDEANVDRFRNALASLAAGSQVVIITHNRGTVQSAGTIYGVTMGDDGASQVISLRVDEAA